MKLAFSVLLSFFTFTLMSQPSGFCRKYVVFKSDVINGTGFGFKNIEAELQISNKITINFGLRNYNAVKTKLIGESYYISNGNKTLNSYFQIKDRVITEFSLYDFGIRHYFVNSVAPAPNGTYIYANYTRGSGSVKGKHRTVNINSWDFLSTEEIVSFNYKNVSFNSLQLGLGQQHILKHFITIDYGGGLGFTRLNHNNPKQLALVAPYIGEHFVSDSNLYRGEIGTNYGVSNNTYVVYNSTPRLFNVGIFCYLKIGIMIF